jgi:hypothetical protein
MEFKQSCAHRRAGSRAVSKAETRSLYGKSSSRYAGCLGRMNIAVVTDEQFLG